jgi:TM2 domain-containing membrane protein YozV
MSSDNTQTDPVPHHVSDVDTWGHPDRNYYVFVALTFFLGFFGLDHVYLRSYDTATKKLLMNVLGFGMWYVWDLIQVSREGQLIRKEGLNSPLDWIRGIGRGTFVPLPSDGAQEGGKQYAAPKSYVMYTVLAILLGFVGADKFYIGKTWQGVAKVFSVFNIFLFMFGLLWVAWDGFNAFFRTPSVLKDGISVPFPYNFLFRDTVDAQKLFKVVEVKEEEPGKPWSFMDMLPALPSLPSLPILPWRELYRELVVPLLQPTVGVTIQRANTAVDIARNAASLGTSTLAKAPGMVAELAQTVTSLPSSPLGAPSTIDAIQQIANAKQATRGQTGGGQVSETGGPGPVLAGALTALLIAGGAKGLYDYIGKVYT